MMRKASVLVAAAPLQPLWLLSPARIASTLESRRGFLHIRRGKKEVIEERMAEIAETRPKLSLAQLFVIFLKAGCGFGGGLGVLALLQEQLVTLRRILPDRELMTLWSIGRLMPSGTMTAVAVAVGHRLCGFAGTVVALVAMIIPGFVCVVVLTIAYGYLAHGAVLDYIDATLLPAALGIVVVSAVRLGKPLFRVSLDMVFAVAACVLLLVTHIGPAEMLLIGGIAGAFLLRGKAEEPKP